MRLIERNSAGNAVRKSNHRRHALEKLGNIVSIPQEWIIPFKTT